MAIKESTDHANMTKEEWKRSFEAHDQRVNERGNDKGKWYGNKGM